MISNTQHLQYKAYLSFKQETKYKYNGLFLDKENPLHNVPRPEGWDRYAHHATIKYDKAGVDLPPALDGNLEVRAIKRTPEVIFAEVTVPEKVENWVNEQNIQTPPWHVTIAAAPGVEPVVAKIATSNGTGEVIQTFYPPLKVPFKTGACGFDKKIYFAD